MNFIKGLKFIALGMGFGIVLAKAEIVSWYRIIEMFRFESFHMYGVIGSAVIIGALAVFFIKKKKITDFQNNPIVFNDKKRSIPRYLVGGTFFGLGWALVGACPGPMFILLGMGYSSILLVIFGALIGTFFYGILKHKLPH